MRNRRRPGISILEALLATLLSALVVGMAVSLTVQLLHLRNSRRIEHNVAASLTRLQQQWRSDVRAAAASDSPSTKPPWELHHGDGGMIQYTLHQDILRRTVLSGTKVTAREEYLLPAGAVVRWEWPQGQTRTARLVIEYPATKTDLRARRTRQFEAYPAADRRLSTDDKR